MAFYQGVVESSSQRAGYSFWTLPLESAMPLPRYLGIVWRFARFLRCFFKTCLEDCYVTFAFFISAHRFNECAPVLKNLQSCTGAACLPSEAFYQQKHATLCNSNEVTGPRDSPSVENYHGRHPVIAFLLGSGAV